VRKAEMPKAVISHGCHSHDLSMTTIPQISPFHHYNISAWFPRKH